MPRVGAIDRRVIALFVHWVRDGGTPRALVAVVFDDSRVAIPLVVVLYMLRCSNNNLQLHNTTLEVIAQ
jgi:hypothetical protein